MATKHTPGPWHVEVRRYERDPEVIECVIIKDADGHRVLDVGADEVVEGRNCTIYEAVSERQLANARLLGAAPDLLEACAAALDNSHGLDASVAVKLSEAIAKARGEGK